MPHGVANAVLLPVIAEYNALADHGRYLKIYNYISEIPAYADEFEPMMLVGAIREADRSHRNPGQPDRCDPPGGKGKEVTAEGDREQNRADDGRCDEERKHRRQPESVLSAGHRGRCTRKAL